MGARTFTGWFLKGIGLAITCLPSTGCYSYSFQERAGGGLARVPIDRNAPRSEVRWSLWWGLRQDTWAPTECLERDESGACTKQITVCDYGAAQVSTEMTWYSAMTMLATVGIAMPSRVTAYCATVPVGAKGESGPPPSGP